MNEIINVTGYWCYEGFAVCYTADGTQWVGNTMSDSVRSLVKTNTMIGVSDWPDHNERAHQDALWFCSGGEQLL